MLHTSELDMDKIINDEMVDNFIVNVVWAVCSTHHTILTLLPYAAIFGRNMLFDLPYLADWTAIGQRRQDIANKTNARENAKRTDFDYQPGQKVMLIQDGRILRKAEDRYLGPFVITSVHTNGTIRIQRGSMSERLNIRRVTPYHSEG